MLIIFFLSMLYISRPIYSEDIIKSITVTCPNGGESWAVGSSHTISWTSTGDIQNVKIDYSIDNGSNWTIITNSTPNVSQDVQKSPNLSLPKCEKGYSWVIPDTISDQCLVRIKDANGDTSDTSDSVFKIVKAEEPKITVADPNGGEEWSVASTHYIRWESRGNIQNVEIDYSIDNGSNWTVITQSTPNISLDAPQSPNLSLPKCENGYSWVIPDTISDQCLVRIKDANGDTSDTSDSVFKIVKAEEPKITIISPNGGEEWSVGSTHFIQWKSTGNIQNVKIEYSIDNGSNWTVIIDSTPNISQDVSKSADPSSAKCYSGYSWVIPNTPSDKCLVRVSDVSGSPSGISDTVFTITQSSESHITLVNPNGKEEWTVGTTHQIIWVSTGQIDNVKIQYSIDNGTNWLSIIDTTPNKFSYSWLIPDTPSSDCLVKVSTIDGSISGTSESTFSIISAKPPVLKVNRDKLNFVYVKDGEKPDNQYIRVSNEGGGILKWSAGSNAAWISLSPTSGENCGIIKVNIDPTGLTEGDYTGQITIQNTDDTTQSVAVAITLKVKTVAQDVAPIGSFDTPVDKATVFGSIPLTGWALDDVRIADVKLYYESNKNLVYIGKATFVEGARPDVGSAYPDYPNNYNGGWGYMLLTNFLPNDGNGVVKIHAIATDNAGHSTNLGVKTIVCDNANSIKPFGALDTPDQGGNASGKGFIVFGWALTPYPNAIPTDGSTISVWVDGVNLGHPVYNQYREDIATLFPGYANSMGAVGYYLLDTSKYPDGLHTISWQVEDSVGQTEGIGSRYFNITNSSSSTSEPDAAADSARIEDNNNEPTGIVKETRIQIHSLDLLKLRVIDSNSQEHALLISDLPIGSSYDAAKGIFYWQPGPGFAGDHTLQFMVTDRNGNTKRKDITVHILPR